ncbi:MAG: hypothetical protein HQK83_02750 [Fibrobacteria bacterium]|nr:hypothetical protein [Fibrobacteria bacterium]
MNTNKHTSLTDTDLQLFLAGVLPLSKSILLRIALLLNRDLRTRLDKLKQENNSFYTQEFQNLEHKLSPRFVKEHEENKTIMFQLFRPRAFRLAAGFACLLLIATSIYYVNMLSSQTQEMVQYASKGSSLGVHLYIRNITTSRVEDYQTTVNGSDTLQLIPLGKDEQQLMVFGWDKHEGLKMIFPTRVNHSSAVSETTLPPALVADGLSDNKLICITSSHVLTSDQVEKILTSAPFLSMENASSSHLEQDIYVQIYTLKGSRHE